jgi:hypothetical protein
MNTDEVTTKIQAFKRAMEKAILAKPKIIVIPMKTSDDQNRIHLCQATNMNGNSCKSRATCGKYCKRHKI